jgi:hypothetical protein
MTEASELDKGLRIAVDTAAADGESSTHYYYIHPQQIPIYKEYVSAIGIGGLV